ncbi:MAG: DUF1570 domain-containing protein [Planctomycetes bacterium]|nr:DUF1570 domain-containing protein [Planctomycetota bacterium]
MIHFSCPACGKHLKAGPSHVGRTTTCPGCRASVTVPDQPPESAVPYVPAAPTAGAAAPAGPDMPAAPTGEAAAPAGAIPEWAVERTVVLGDADDLGCLGQESSAEIEAIRDPILPGAPPPLLGIPRRPSARRGGSGSGRQPGVPGRSSGPRPAGRSSSAVKNLRRSRQRVLVLGAALGCAFAVAGFFLLVLFAGGEKGAVEPPAPLSSPPPSAAPVEPEGPAVEAARLAGSYRFAGAARVLERARSGAGGSEREIAALEKRMAVLDRVFAALVSALSRESGAGGTQFERPGRGAVRILRAGADGIEYEETSLVEDSRRVSKTWDSLSPSFVLLLIRAVGLETRDPAGVEAFTRYFGLVAPTAIGGGAPERSFGPAQDSWEEFMVELAGMLRRTLEGSNPEGLLALAERSLTEDLRSRLDRELREASFGSGNRVAQLAADPLWHGIVRVGGYDLILGEMDRRRALLAKSPGWQSLRSGIGEARARAAAYASAERRALLALATGDLAGARSEFSGGSYAGDPWFEATVRCLDRPEEIASLFGSGGGRLAEGSSGRGEGSGKAGDRPEEPAGRAGPEPGAAEETPGRGATLRAANLVNEAIRLYNEDRLEAALEKARAALAADPNDADAHGIAGQILFDLSRFDEAVPAIDRAAELDAEVWGNRSHRIAGQVAFYRGQDEVARNRLSRMTGRAPSTDIIPFLMDPPGMQRKRSESGHYLVYVDETLARLGGGERAAAVMQLIYWAYSKVFPFEKEEGLVYRAYIFGAGSGYRAFYEKLGHDLSDALGFYVPSYRILVVDADPEGAPPDAHGLTDRAIKTMFHEGFHQFIHMFVPNVPLWFNEGLAEYFGPSRLIGKKKLNVGVVVPNDPAGRYYTRLESIKKAIAMGDPLPPLPLFEFLRQTDEQWKQSQERELLNYAEAWSLVHFLLHDKRLGTKGPDLIKNYFAALREGKTPEQAHAETFGKLDLGKLEQAWIEYVQNL